MLGVKAKCVRPRERSTDGSELDCVGNLRPPLSDPPQRRLLTHSTLTALTEIPRFCSSKFPTLGRSAA